MSADNLPKATPPADPEEPQEEKPKVKIRCGVFFDGTLNNRTNINQRLVAISEDKTTDKKLTDEELAVVQDVKSKMSDEDILNAMVLYDKYKADDPNDDNSYEAFYSNVVKLERHLDTTGDAEYQHKLKVYVEGSGSINKGKDDWKGFAFAKGMAGIEKKVDWGLEKVLVAIKDSHRRKEEPITLITLDVIGFSRGAAAARYFIHRALYDYDGAKYRAYQETIKQSGDPDIGAYLDALKALQAVKAALQDNGYTVGEVKICFAGLFDTVSSFGYLLPLNSNNTEDLSLDAVKLAEEAVHLVSADEHRTYFSLTNIASAGGNGREVYLPGVHSDIGGGYRETGDEQQVIYRGFKAQAEADRQRLIKTGWYTEEEIKLKVLGPVGPKSPTLLAQTEVTRPGISGHYNRIPLHLMAGYARKKKIVFKGALDKDEKVPEDMLGDTQQKIKDYVAQHDGLGARTSEAKHWLDDKDWDEDKRRWMRRLRHDYFHFSAKIKMGHTPRIEGGERVRQVHRG